MASVYEIPLIAGPQNLAVSIPNGVANITLRYSDAANGEGGWIMDIATQSGVAIVCGIPLITGADLLAQYAYLGIGVKMFVSVEGNPGAVPTFSDIGSTARLYVEF